MKRAPLIAAALAAGLLSPLGAWAQRRAEPAPPPPPASSSRADPKDAGGAMPLEKIFAELNRLTPGKQLDAKQDKQDGRTVWRIPWKTTDGRKIDYVVDVSGAIISHNP